MKIGVVVDGQAEFRSLPLILGRIDTQATFVKLLYADMQPNAAPAKIVKATRSHLQWFARKCVDRVVICLDYENRQDCPCSWVQKLEREFAANRDIGVPVVLIVLKMRMFENWLVSDIDTLKAIRARFEFTNAHESRISPDRADAADATHILKSAAKKVSYHKVNDAVAIMRLFDPYRGAQNSRSFRKLLQTLGCRVYDGQSRRPVVEQIAARDNGALSPTSCP